MSAYPVEAEIRQYREYASLLGRQIVDGVSWIHRRISSGKHILAEGANAALLDIDFGTYPFVTSAPTTAGGICTGLGVPPSSVKCIIGVVKAFLTRVGNGPFPTECTSPDCPDDQGISVNPEEADFFDGWLAKQDEIRAKGVGHGPQPPRTGQFVGDFFRDIGYEYGTTTGRPRRCGWLDIPLTKFAAIVNGYASINITKLDCLSGLKTVKIGVAYELNGRKLELGEFPSHLPSLKSVKVEYLEMPGWSEDITKCTAYAQLPDSAKAYVDKIEQLLGVPVSWVGVGPDREAMFLKG
jgi:adenylosuccinate synthase